MKNFRIALAQVNPTVGDLKGNARLILEYMEKAKKEKADLVVFPELVITGCPPEDLLLMPSFIDDNLKTLKGVVPASKGMTAVVGFVDRKDDIYNAAALLHNGKWVGTYHKHCLPNYGVFDEQRYFQRGANILVFDHQGVRVGLSICEDIWQPTGPLTSQTLHGDVELAVNISASPFFQGKSRERQQMLSTRARDHTVALAYVNLVGGQDELIFDGGSLVLDEKGNLLAKAHAFRQELLLADLNLRNVFHSRLLTPKRREEKRTSPFNPDRFDVISLPTRSKTRTLRKPVFKPLPEEPTEIQEIFSALVLGTQDYVRKNGFKEVVVGLSGGIDSSLTAALAVEALGKKNVHGVFLPSRFSSKQSRKDAEALSGNLDIDFQILPIDPVYQSYRNVFEPLFKNAPEDVTEENLQARIRGNILMGLSNKFGWFVLTTGNKSETSVGYCTLYGDTAGGLAVLKDVPKMTVYALARHFNRIHGRQIVPKSVLKKPPSAELRPNQLDADSLPPYDELDSILYAYVEEDLSLDEIVQSGQPRSRVKDVIRKVNRNEYKRRQAPPGLKITPKAFGRDRRLPITNRYNS